MRTSVLAWSMFGFWLVAADARETLAQGTVSVAASYDLSYSELGERTAKGAHVDVWSPVWNIVGEIGLDDFEGVLVSSIVGGVRFPIAARTAVSYRPFVQLLAGQWRCCGISHAVIQPGAGIELGSGRKIALRGQFDYRRIFFEDPGENAYRFSAGVVWHLDK